MSPAVSIKQRRMMAIGEHEPEKLYARNRGVLGLGKGILSEYASTRETGLPVKSGVARMKRKVRGLV